MGIPGSDPKAIVPANLICPYAANLSGLFDGKKKNFP